MSVVMANVPSSASMVTGPGSGDLRPFHIDSSKNQRVVPIQSAPETTLSKHSDIFIPECAPLERNLANLSERGESGNNILKLPSLGKRKEPSSPLDELLDNSSESSRADSPLPPRKVARISHTLMKVTDPTKLARGSLLEASSSRIPAATPGGIYTNPFEVFLNPTGVPPCPRPKNRGHTSAVLPTPPPSKSASDDGLPSKPKRVAMYTKASVNEEAPRRVADLTKDIITPPLRQLKNTTPAPTPTPAANNASHQPGAASGVIAAPRIQMFTKKPESSSGSRSKGGGMTNELKSLTQLNASIKSKRHVTSVVPPSSQPYSLPLVVGWDQRDVAARGLLDPWERSRSSYPVDDDSSNKKEDISEEDKRYAEAKRRLEEAERVERLHMQALILARNRTEEARRALEEQDKVYDLRSRLIR